MLLLTTLLLFAGCAPASPDISPRNPHVDVVHYAFSLTLSDESNELFGEATLSVRFLAPGVSALDLDLVGPARTGKGMQVTAVRAGDQELRFTHEDDRLRIPLTPVPAAEAQRVFTIFYHGTPADGLIISNNKHGDRTFFGDNWPNRAHHWLPTVDHPSDKATVEFIVTAPEHYQVIASGTRVEETDLPDERRLTHWRSTVPLATKVMVIGAARFAVQYLDEYEGVPVESWVYPQDRDAGFYDYALAEPILQYFSSHVGPYPYEKLANVQSKTRYGGMENAGNIFYTEGSVTGNRQSESLLAHEIAHQWFGDSVTERDWHHIWLSEGFATYFTQLYLEHTYGRDRLVAGMKKTRADVLHYYAGHPDSPVVDTTITELNDLLSTNAYQKGGWVLHMLRYVVGDTAFWDGIEAYYRQYRDGNALTVDFQRVMEAAAGRDLGWFFRQWLFQPGQPDIQGGWRYDTATRQLTITLNQVQPGGAPFRFLLELGLYSDAGTPPHIEVVDVTRPSHTFTFTLDAAPSDVVLDPNTWILMKADFTRQ